MSSADSLRLPSACPSDLPSAAFPSSLLRRLPLPAFTRSITLPHALAYNRLLPTISIAIIPQTQPQFLSANERRSGILRRVLVLRPQVSGYVQLYQGRVV